VLSVQLLRERPDEVRASLARRHTDTPLVDILGLDAERRALLQEAEGLKAKRNEVSRQLGRDRGDPVAFERARENMRQVGDRIKELESAIEERENRLDELLLQVPNLPDPDVPDGEGEHHNVVVRTEGEPREFPYAPQPHWDLAERLGIIDFERGVKLSGTRFYVLRGAGARLQRALIQWMLDFHVQRGYTEIYPPMLVRGAVMQGAGQLPKFFDVLYRDAEEDFFLIPTAEVPLTNLFRDEILPAGALPIRYVASTPCFRREKVAAGRDVRGIKRVHQFEKVEMYQFVEPDGSPAALDEMLDSAEELCRQLGVPHRVVELCTGDLGFNAVKTYDVEVWAPGCREWLEVSSVSNCRDFQARRANIRFRPEAGARPQFPHTLNGSGLALPRVIIAILENYQAQDGTVTVPDVLQPYAGGLEVIR